MKSYFDIYDVKMSQEYDEKCEKVIFQLKF